MMKRNYYRFVLTVCLATICFATNLLAKPPTAWEQIERMGPGINLGNVFDAPDGEGSWWKGTARPEFFDDFNAAGFKNVRLPVTWQKHTAETEPYAVDAKFMELIAEVVGWANQRGLVVVLNAHHEGWFKKDPNGQMKKFETLWRQIATRFKDVPDELLVFEILNESDEKTINAAQTTEMNDRILKVIRETNPTRCVIVGGIGDNDKHLLKELIVPNDPYIIATYHCYDPWFFVCGEPRNPAEAKWGSEAQKAEYLKIMDPIKKWSDLHKVPIYLGEWGTSIKCDSKSRIEYYHFVSSQAKARGFSYAIWDEGGDMLIYKRETRQWNTDILQAVFPAEAKAKDPNTSITKSKEPDTSDAKTYEPKDMNTSPASLVSKALQENRTGQLLGGMFVSDNGGKFPYRLYIPTPDANTGKLPLVVFLHGAGELGDDNTKQLAHFPRRFINTENQAKYPCYILAPQCPKSDAWSSFPEYPASAKSSARPTNAMRLAIELIERTISDCNIDKNRVYVTGLSLGGEGTFDIVSRRPDLFAAAVPVCGIADVEKADSMKSVPFWVFHGDSDNINPVKYSRDIVEALKKTDATPKYTEYKGAGHDVWGKAYGEPELLSWMFAQHK
jgi:predicted esterase